MSATIFRCVICGCAVRDSFSNVHWVNEFRGLYSGPDGIVLTGVGAYRDAYRALFIAPPNPDARWQDEGYYEPEADRFGAMTLPDVNGRHGFVFHNQCWGLLKWRATAARTVSLPRLYSVLDSLPFFGQGLTLSWGHDYGGAIAVDNEHNFPWENRFQDREYDVRVRSVYSEDPFFVNEVYTILGQTPEEPPLPSAEISTSGTLTEGHVSDCFGVLPMELRIDIAVRLDTDDVLNARLASRSFWPIFHSSAFWASRFLGDGERSWLHEAEIKAYHPTDGQQCDWRWLYRRTALSRIGLALENRRRVWRLISGIIDLLDISWAGDEQDLWQATTTATTTATSAWVEATGKIREQWSQPPFFEGCQIQRTQEVRTTILDGVPFTMEAYLVRLGDMVYVCGLCFRRGDRTGDSISLGYTSMMKRTVVLSAPCIGFIVAVGIRGVQAIRCVLESTEDSNGIQLSAWLGDPSGVPQTNRLVMGHRIRGIRAYFDGCKMVGIAVSGDPDSHAHLDASNTSLLRTALWYPEIPWPSLHLNERSFFTSQDFAHDYEPLIWVSFGGVGGASLRHLTSVTFRLRGALRQIDFWYDNKAPEPHVQFGRFRPKDSDKAVYFNIDGPGGERINGIGVHVDTTRRDFLGRCFLVAFKVYTNRHRSIYVGGMDMPSNAPETKLQVSPGTVITGFTGHKHADYGIISLGAISEEICEN